MYYRTDPIFTASVNNLSEALNCNEPKFISHHYLATSKSSLSQLSFYLFICFF